jgi:asparagine synthase (glutamine-hydrolysing)
MSDIFLSAGVPVDLDDIAAQLRWTEYTETWQGTSGTLSWLLTRVDDAVLWSPAWDDSSQTRVLIAGRFAFDEREWRRAEGLRYQGGLAARLVLDGWLQSGPRVVDRLNGAGLAIIIDEANREVHLWTDRMGFYPVFAWTGKGFVICSHTDVAASALENAGCPCDFDAVTMADFLRTGTATHPYTYWHGIEQLDAGTQYQFTFGETPRMAEQGQYWRPAYFDQPYLDDRRDIVDRLADALTSAVRKRTLPRLSKVAVMLSAGADSRAALFAACIPNEVSCFTFYDEPNEELRGAKALAAAAGARHVGYERNRDYYIENASEAVRVSGGMWSVESAHSTGFIRAIAKQSFGTVMTG